MQKFLVTFRRLIEQVAEIEIDAHTSVEAETQAKQRLGEADWHTAQFPLVFDNGDTTVETVG